MRGKSLALLVLALGCGLVASLGITQVLGKRADSSAPSDTTPLCVAKSEIAAGALVSAQEIKIEQWPKDKVPPGAVVRMEDLEGRRARQKIYVDEPILQPKLLTHGQVPIDGMVPKGLRLVAITVSVEAIHSGLVLPGARCDVQVFIRADPALAVNETRCMTILQDIRVFAVNDVTSTESTDPKTPDTRSIPLGKTVSLLVTPAQAQIVTLASQLGTIRLVLRSGEDSEQPKIAAMTAHELLGTSGGGQRAKENPKAEDDKRFMDWADKIRQSLHANAKAAPGAASKAPQSFTMRIRTGADVNDVTLVKNSAVLDMPGDEGTWTATGLGPTTHTKAIGETRGPKNPGANSTTAPAGPAVTPKSGVDGLLPSIKSVTSPPNGV